MFAYLQGAVPPAPPLFFLLSPARDNDQNEERETERRISGERA